MSLKIKNFLLTGPFGIDETTVRANQDPAVFAIVSKGGEPWNPTFKVLDVGETGDAGTVFANHPNRSAWAEGADGKLGIYFLTFSRKDGHAAASRLAVVEQIREALKATGGVIPLQGV